MTEKSVVVEMTRCYPNTHEEIFSQIDDLCTKQAVPTGNVHVLCRLDQAMFRSRYPRIAHWREISGDRASAHIAVRALLTELAGDGQSRTVLLFSYDGGVLGIAGEGGWGQLTIVPMPLSSLKHGRKGQNQESAGRSGQWNFDRVIPLNEALKVLIEVLRCRGSNSLEKHLKFTELRPALALADSRFIGNGLATGTAGMMSQLVQHAEDIGLIEVNRTVLTQNPLIWMTNQASAVIPVGAGRSDENPKSGEVNADVSVIAHSRMTTASEPVQHRSRVLESVLKDVEMGPYAQARKYVYDAIEAVSSERGAISLQDLVTDAIAQAQQRMAATGMDTDQHPQPWKRIKLFVTRLLTDGGCLKDEAGEQVRSGWSAQQSKVASLDVQWRIKADAEIILALVRKTRIDNADEENLAGLLFHDRTGREALRRVTEIVTFLIQSEKIEEFEVDGRHCLRVRGADLRLQRA